MAPNTAAAPSTGSRAVSRAGRSITTAEVKADFGRGATLLAKEAKRAGLIDKISAPELRAVPALRDEDEFAQADDPAEASAISKPADGGQETTMNLKDLKAQHRGTYDELLAEGHAAGVKEERDRVCAHLEMGETASDTKTAFGAIREGTEMTQTMTAKYLAAGMRKADKQARQKETDDAAKTTDDAGADASKKGESKPDLGDAVLAVLDGNKKVA